MPDKVIEFAGYTFDIVGGRYVLRGRQLVEFSHGDYGHDPILTPDGEPTGYIRMVPSGRVLTVEEYQAEKLGKK